MGPRALALRSELPAGCICTGFARLFPASCLETNQSSLNRVWTASLKTGLHLTDLQHCQVPILQLGLPPSLQEVVTLMDRRLVRPYLDAGLYVQDLKPFQVRTRSRTVPIYNEIIVGLVAAVEKQMAERQLSTEKS